MTWGNSLKQVSVWTRDKQFRVGDRLNESGTMRGGRSLFVMLTSGGCLSENVA